MHVHKSKCDRFGDFIGQKHDQGSTCLPQTAAGPVLRSLDLDVAPRTADRLSHQTHTYKQTSAKDKKQYTKQITFTFCVHACVYNMTGPELRMCLVLFIFFLDQLGFNFMLGSYARCYTLVMVGL